MKMFYFNSWDFRLPYFVVVLKQKRQLVKK